MAKKTGKFRWHTLKEARRDFLAGYKIYDTSQGRGNAAEWRRAFKVRMSPEEAAAILGGDEPRDILDLDEDATMSEIKSAYRAACLKHHPDQGGDAEIFKRCVAAYVALGGRD